MVNKPLTAFTVVNAPLRDAIGLVVYRLPLRQDFALAVFQASPYMRLKLTSGHPVRRDTKPDAFRPKSIFLALTDLPHAMTGNFGMMNMMPASESMANATELSGPTNEYLRIGDMAKEFGVTLRTLRFYEDKGLIQPRREGNTRLYTHRDVTRLKLIMLGRKIGFSLREVKQIMDLYDPHGSNTKQLRTLLDKSERQLVRLEKQRSALEEAIVDLKSAMTSWRSTLAARQTNAA